MHTGSPVAIATHALQLVHAIWTKCNEVKTLGSELGTLKTALESLRGVLEEVGASADNTVITPLKGVLACLRKASDFLKRVEQAGIFSRFISSSSNLKELGQIEQRLANSQQPLQLALQQSGIHQTTGAVKQGTEEQNANHKQTQQLIQEAMKKSGGDREAINKAQAKYMDQLSHMASAQQASSKDMATLLDFVHTLDSKLDAAENRRRTKGVQQTGDDDYDGGQSQAKKDKTMNDLCELFEKHLGVHQKLNQAQTDDDDSEGESESERDDDPQSLWLDNELDFNDVRKMRADNGEDRDGDDCPDLTACMPAKRRQSTTQDVLITSMESAFLEGGIYYFEMLCQGERRQGQPFEHAFGIGFTSDTRSSYQTLPGMTFSVGYDGDDGIVGFDGRQVESNLHTYTIGDVVGAGIGFVNPEEAYVFFTRNGEVERGTLFEIDKYEGWYPCIGLSCGDQVSISATVNYGQKDFCFKGLQTPVQGWFEGMEDGLIWTSANAHLLKLRADQPPWVDSSDVDTSDEDSDSDNPSQVVRSQSGRPSPSGGSSSYGSFAPPVTPPAYSTAPYSSTFLGSGYDSNSQGYPAPDLSHPQYPFQQGGYNAGYNHGYPQAPPQPPAHADPNHSNHSNSGNLSRDMGYQQGGYNTNHNTGYQVQQGNYMPDHNSGYQHYPVQQDGYNTDHTSGYQPQQGGYTPDHNSDYQQGGYNPHHSAGYPQYQPQQGGYHSPYSHGYPQ
ncbi:hypothetical protein ABBQ32_004085 [Trebouxia sp. C0010 RCD-2024]